MKLRYSNVSQPVLWVTVLLLAVGVAWAGHDYWMPTARALMTWSGAPADAGTASASSGDDEHHDHAHDEATSLHLSEQARRNIGVTDDMIRAVELQPYWRTITVPSMVVERRGKTNVTIAAPLTGIVTGIHVIEGEAVRSGALLFRLRLTHEDLVQAQTNFLKTLEQLDVEKREIERLDEITQKGVVAGKVLLERQYEEQKLEAVLRANREALLLHGLSERQVSWIEEHRSLFREIRIVVPALHDDDSLHHDAEQLVHCASDVAQTASHLTHRDAVRPLYDCGGTRESEFIVQRLSVHKGESVDAGDSLCVLADYRQLYIQGRAFEQDAEQLTRAVQQDWPVRAVFENRTGQPQQLKGLQIVYLSSEVDPETRAFYFYVSLTNERLQETETPEGHRFVTWKYKPGQRANLHVPVERWTDRIVLPVDAVATEGAESYVFTQNGHHFDRRPVHVLYRDQFSAVVANDGSLFPGEAVATTGAHQMQMALKQKAGGVGGSHGHMH